MLGKTSGKEEYYRKLVTADEEVGAVKSEDLVDHGFGHTKPIASGCGPCRTKGGAGGHKHPQPVEVKQPRMGRGRSQGKDIHDSELVFFVKTAVYYKTVVY